METKATEISVFKYLEVKALNDSGKVVNRIDVTNHTDRSIDRIGTGLNINMNHESYYTVLNTSDSELEAI